MYNVGLSTLKFYAFLVLLTKCRPYRRFCQTFLNGNDFGVDEYFRLFKTNFNFRLKMITYLFGSHALLFLINLKGRGFIFLLAFIESCRKFDALNLSNVLILFNSIKKL